LLVFAAASTWSQNGDHAIEAAMISAPPPIFPDEARARHLAGCGIYQLEIDPNGRSVESSNYPERRPSTSEPRGDERSDALASTSGRSPRCKASDLLRI
jgi:hypothetical protein